jgi:hypothetical protein
MHQLVALGLADALCTTTPEQVARGTPTRFVLAEFWKDKPRRC